MPPRLAACLFTVFIVWLLLRDAKRVELSWALWIPTLWVGIMASKALAYWLAGNPVFDVTEQLGGGSALDGSPIDRNGFIVLIVLALLTLARRRVDFVDFVSTNRLLAIFYLYLAFSILWSPTPFVAFKRYIKDVGTILMILVILTESQPMQALHRVLARCAYVLIPLSVDHIKYYPEVGRYTLRWTYQTAYRGATTNKNSLGVLAMIGGLTLLWSLLDSGGAKKSTAMKLGEAVVLCMCLWLLQIANSATAQMCFFLGAALLLACRTRWMKTHLTVFATGLSVALLASAAFLWSPATRGMVAENFGRDSTLTTRTDLWEAVMGLHTNLLFGAGYASVWLTEAGWKLARQFEGPHAHNGYLENYLNTGAIGLALLLVWIVGAGRNALRQLGRDSFAGPFVIALFVIGLIYNYTEVAFNKDNVVFFGLLVTAIRYSPAPALRRYERPLIRDNSKLTQHSLHSWANRSSARRPA